LTKEEGAFIVKVMADSAVLNSEQQRLAQEDQGDDQSSHYASMYGGSPSFSGGTMQPGGYGDQAQQGYGSPGYGSGVMPKRDYGFEEYVSHHFGAGDYGDKDVFTKGPYAGMSKGEAYEKMRDDYANMSPEDRAQWERKTFEQNDRSPSEMRSQGFQYSDQTNQWGNKSAPNQPGQDNGYSSGVSSDPRAGLDLSSVQQPDDGKRTHYGMDLGGGPPSFSRSGGTTDTGATNLRQANQYSASFGPNADAQLARLRQAGVVGPNQTISDPRAFQAAVAKLPASTNPDLLSSTPPSFQTPALPSSQLNSRMPGTSVAAEAPSFQFQPLGLPAGSQAQPPGPRDLGELGRQNTQLASYQNSRMPQSQPMGPPDLAMTDQSRGLSGIRPSSNIVQPVGGSMAGPTGTPYVAPSAKPMNATPAIPNPPPAMKVASR
jgi:hypothetical protein